MVDISFRFILKMLIYWAEAYYKEKHRRFNGCYEGNWTKSKSSPITGLDRPRGFQEVKVPRCRDNGTGWW